jgi:hypothetical protein
MNVKEMTGLDCIALLKTQRFLSVETIGIKTCR